MNIEAKCSYCSWSGFINLDIKLQWCDPCPTCGRYMFSVKLPVVNSNRKAFKVGWTIGDDNWVGKPKIDGDW